MSEVVTLQLLPGGHDPQNCSLDLLLAPLVLLKHPKSVDHNCCGRQLLLYSLHDLLFLIYFPLGTIEI